MLVVDSQPQWKHEQDEASTLPQPRRPDDLRHEFWKTLLHGKLFRSPVDNVSRLLDVDCSTGLWALEVSQYLPHSQVIGVDPKPPRNIPTLPNLQFIKADAEGPWNFAKHEDQDDDENVIFDLIMLRIMAAKVKDWQSLFSKCFANLRPGGFVEAHEAQMAFFSDVYDIQNEADSPLMRLSACFRRALSQKGIDCLAAQEHSEQLKRAGFTEIAEKTFTCHLYHDSESSEQDEELTQLAIETAFAAIDLATKTLMNEEHLRTINMDAEELSKLRKDAKGDLQDNAASKKYYWKLSIHTARKPDSWMDL